MKRPVHIKLIFTYFFALLYFFSSATYISSDDWIQTDWSGGDGQNEWSDATQFQTETNINYQTTGEINNDVESWPEPSLSTQETTFQAANSEAVGVIGTDGTYLYTKSWSSYDGNDTVIAIIGTGYNGTTEGQDYGDLATVNRSMSGFYLDGYFYNGYTTNGRRLQRVNVGTGAVENTSNFSSRLMARNTGGNAPNNYDQLLVTTDGTYIYNVAYSQGSGYDGWRVKVYDPSDFSLVKQFDSGAVSYYTDGIFADGTYIYYIEWVNNNNARITRASAIDGTIDDIWTIDQGTTKIINGQYDWVNNKVWLGDLMGPDIYRYPGVVYFEDANLISSYIDTGSQTTFQNIYFNGTETLNETNIKFQVRTAPDNAGSPGLWTDWLGSTDTTDHYEGGIPEGESLNDSHNGHQWVQYKAFLSREAAFDGNTPILNDVTIDYYPASDNPPNTFTLLSPTDGSQLTDLTPILTWESNGDPDGGDSVTFSLWYGKDSSFDSRTEVSVGAPASYEIPSNLDDNSTYYWKVKATDNDGAITWSDKTGFFYTNLANELPSVPTLISPPDGSNIVDLTPTLTLNNSSDNDPADTLTYSFEIYRDAALTDLATSKAGIAETASETSWETTDTLLYNRTFYWQARANDGTSYGPWSSTFSFFLSNGWIQTDWSGGSGQEIWADETMYNTATQVDGSFYIGSLILEAEGLPEPSLSTQETTFQAANSEAVGVIGTDGTYLYTKSWYSYDGNDTVVAIIGTGYNGTTEGQDYGDLATVNRSMSGFYLDGYFYNGYTSNGQNLQRVDVNSGTIENTSNFGSRLMRRNTGGNAPGNYDQLIVTTDGTYIYNVSYSQGSGYNGWRVKVYDPSDFSLVRQFDSGATSYYTDGIFADGTYIYYIEWANNNNARITRASATDGTINDTWAIDQGTTKVINGQYDWVNNKVWLGDLMGPDIYRYPGFTFKTTGTIESSVFDSGSASNFSQISWNVDLPIGTSVKFQLRTGNTKDTCQSSDWTGPDGTTSTFYTSTGTDISSTLNEKRWIQYKAFLDTTSNAYTPKITDIIITMFPVGESRPDVFNLLTPVKGQSLNTLSPTITWEEATDPDEGDWVTYTLWYSENSDFNSKTEIADIAGTSQTLAGLSEDTRYYWKVKAVDSFGAETWSNQTDWYFQVNASNQTPGMPTLYTPDDGETITFTNPVLRIINATDNDPYDVLSYEYEVYSNSGLTTLIDTSGVVAEQAGGITSYTVAATLEFGLTYWWRARATDGFAYSNWTSSRTFSITRNGVWMQTDWSGGDNQIEWIDKTKYYDSLNTTDEIAGEVSVAASGYPRPSSATQETTFPAANSEAVGVIGCDGTYLYTKSWYNYDGNDTVIARIGTGYGGTNAGQDYGDLATVNRSMSGFYLDGYFYNGYSQNGQRLQRVNVSTEAVENTTNFGSRFMARNTGSNAPGNYDQLLVTTDGTYIYNVAYSRGSGYNGWRVKVYDPSDLSLVRQFDSGTSSYYTDGIFADGIYIYYIEWTNNNNSRITRANAIDGTIDEQWAIDQGTTKVINGQYDPVNNKVWLGDLMGPDIYRYHGKTFLGSGSLESSQFDTGSMSTYQQILWNGIEDVDHIIKVQLRGADDDNSPVNWTDWMGPDGTSLTYYTNGSGENIKDLDSYRWIQYKVFFENTNQNYSGVLEEITISYEADDDQIGPSFSNFTPPYAGESEPFYIEVTIIDASGIYDDATGSSGQGVYLIWDNDGNLLNGASEIQMTSVGGDRFRSVIQIAGQNAGVNLVYKIFAYDNDFDNNNIKDRTKSESTEQKVIIGERSFSVEPDSLQQIAGQPFKAIITSQIIIDGILTKDETFDGTINITPNYIQPVSGEVGISPETFSGFSEGILETELNYDDCGDIKLEVKDSTNDTVTGFSDTINFSPYTISIEGGLTNDKYTFVYEPFSLTFQAKNYKGEIAPNFSGNLILSLESSNLLTGTPRLNKTNVSVTGGNSEIIGLTCDTFGSFKIKTEFETGIPSLGTLNDKTDNISFIEKEFNIEFSNPPPDRNFFYINETFRATVTALDYNGNRLESFTGEVNITDGTQILETYLFLPEDAGQHIIAVSVPEEGVFSIKATDVNYPEITSVQKNINIFYGAIIVKSADVPVGQAELEVIVVDRSGNIITEENSLSFRISFDEANPNSSCKLLSNEEDIPVKNGKAIITITNTESEEVTVSALSSPELESVPGVVNFGTIGVSGIRILFWRER